MQLRFHLDERAAEFASLCSESGTLAFVAAEVLAAESAAVDADCTYCHRRAGCTAARSWYLLVARSLCSHQRWGCIRHTLCRRTRRTCCRFSTSFFFCFAEQKAAKPPKKRAARKKKKKSCLWMQQKISEKAVLLKEK